MSAIWSDLIYSVLFGTFLTILTFGFGQFVSRRCSSPLLNPLLISCVLCAGVLLVLRIPYQAYKVGGSVVSAFLGPATCALALNIYKQWPLLKKHWLPVLGGCAAGSLVSVCSVYGLCRLFHLDSVLTFSLLPKSVTTPIATQLASLNGGIPGVAVAAVLCSGVLGAILAQPLQKTLHLKNRIALGVGIGTASHALGTSKALEIGETEGAFSSIAIGISGLFTSLWLALLF